MKIDELSMEDCIHLNLYINKSLKALKTEVDDFDKVDDNDKLECVLNALPHVIPLRTSEEHLKRLVESKDSNVVEHVRKYLQSSEHRINRQTRSS